MSYYATPEWRSLRKQALQRDRYRCTTPRCGSTKRLTVDHILSRRRGGTDTLPNLRTLCIDCDNQVKEATTGERRSGGVIRLKGCDADGWPR